MCDSMWVSTDSFQVATVRDFFKNDLLADKNIILQTILWAECNKQVLKTQGVSVRRTSLLNTSFSLKP